MSQEDNSLQPEEAGPEDLNNELNELQDLGGGMSMMGVDSGA